MYMYMEVAAILSGKNVQWVVVGNSISCRLSVDNSIKLVHSS